MNTELLTKVKEQILAHPETFDMGAWCGTACCIAGHAVVLAGIPVSEGQAESVAGSALGLPARQAYGLFYVRAWPKRFRDRFEAVTDGIRLPFPGKEADAAKIAAERIDHFIATNGEE